MSNLYKFSAREWLVPPVLLPVFFVLLIAAAMLNGSPPRRAGTIGSGKQLVRPDETNPAIVG